MDELEKQQEEIERLQKKLARMTRLLEETDFDEKNRKPARKRGRPPVDGKIAARIVSLAGNGLTMRDISAQTGVSLGAVHKIIAKAEKACETAYMYMDRDRPATLIYAYGVTGRVKITNFTDDVLSRAFGVKEHPTWEDYEEFLEYRCMPRTRYGIREELKAMGLDTYDPVMIIEKTNGRLYDDGQWLWKLSEALRGICRETVRGNIDADRSATKLGRLVMEDVRSKAACIESK